MTLRTQFRVVVAMLGFYVLVAGGSFWMTSRAAAGLARSFERDLVVLNELPQLQSRLRQLDSLTDQYLLTGNQLWLEKRSLILQEVRASLAGLLKRLEEQGPDYALVLELERRMKSGLVEHNQWIERRQANRLSGADAAKLAARKRPHERLAELAAGIGRINTVELESRRSSVEKASRATVWLILLTGALASSAIAYFLARHLIGPIASLERHASAWEPGKPWNPPAPAAGPEIISLYGSMGALTTRLSEQFHKEAELARLKTQLVSMVSHDFNNVLNILDCLRSLLESSEGKSEEDKRSEYYRMLKANIRALAQEAQTLLNLGRLETGHFALKPKRLDVSEVLKNAASQLGILSERKNQSLKISCPPGPSLVRADPDALALVVTNLLSNAIKYTPEGGSIVLGVEPAPGAAGRVRVFCADTGIGIAPADAAKIFSGYFRTEKGKAAAKGFGVGLSLAKGFVEAHESALEVSGAPGQGSKFYFSLPLWKDGQE